MKSRLLPLATLAVLVLGLFKSPAQAVSFSAGNFDGNSTSIECTFDPFTPPFFELCTPLLPTISGNEITLTTSDQNNAAASIFSKAKFSLKDNFTISAELNFGNITSFGSMDNGADGMAFVLQPITSTPDLNGSIGGGLGYHSLTNAFAVEFDTYVNTEDEGIPQDSGSYTIDHISLQKNNAYTHSSWGITPRLLGEIEDNAWHKFEFSWVFDRNGSPCGINSPALTVKFDQNADGDFSDTFTSGGQSSSEIIFDRVCINLEDYFAPYNYLTHFGFTAGTGAATNNQRVRNIAYEFSSRPGPVASTLLTFAINGADNNSYPQTEVKGTTAKLWKNVLTRAGYTFTGWNTKADGTGTSYADQADFKFDADYITLYAQWSLIKSAPTITWANPAAITTATPLSATQLNATANVAGTCAYTPALGTLLAAGKQSLTCVFTPTDTTKYSSVTKSVEVEVLALPVITWANPAAITNGAALTTTQLNATANMAGSFAYSPALATVLKPGKQKLTVTFTPTDTRLSAVSKDVEIDVLPALTPTAQSITTRSGESGNGAIGSTTADASVAVKSLGTGLEKASATRSQLTVTAKADYSGKTSLVITVTDEGRSVDLTVAVTVTPVAPASATYRLASLSSSSISWSAANGATSYVVTIDGKSSCTATATSCQVSAAVGPKSVVSVTSLGGNETQSAATSAAYQSPTKPITAATVNFATGKAMLSDNAEKELKRFAVGAMELGITQIGISVSVEDVSESARSSLNTKRVDAVANFLKAIAPDLKLELRKSNESRNLVTRNSLYQRGDKSFVVLFFQSI